MRRRDLEKQLRAQRTKPSDIDGLLAIADTLGHAELPKLSRAARQRIEEATTHPSRAPKIAAWSLAGSFAALVIVVIGAQSSQPGSPLYAVKNATDTINAFFFPSETKQPPRQPANRKDELKQIDQPSPQAIEDSVNIKQPPQASSPQHKNSDNRHEPDGKSDRDRPYDERKRNDHNRLEDFLRRLYDS